ncbi:hypothetical protein HNY73_020675 [Argiope bruennichi]|uniref:Uncharacterized protein n=1 Tax=Argiope bruennichi TaxID=94029 RepID=A0A8T0E8P1_ARGBR|nr:hypothetical protein HNY73_020675 [Argiope bruennichi]
MRHKRAKHAQYDTRTGHRGKEKQEERARVCQRAQEEDDTSEEPTKTAGEYKCKGGKYPNSGGWQTIVIKISAIKVIYGERCGGESCVGGRGDARSNKHSHGCWTPDTYRRHGKTSTRRARDTSLSNIVGRRITVSANRVEDVRELACRQCCDTEKTAEAVGKRHTRWQGHRRRGTNAW